MFNIYEKVRIKEGCMPLPANLKVGDIGMVDDVTYMPIGWYKVSFDKNGIFRLAMQEKELEKA